MAVFKGRIISKQEHEKEWTVKIKDDTNNDFHTINIKKSKAKNLHVFLDKTDIIAYYNQPQNNIPYFFIDGETLPLQADKNFRLRKDIGFEASCILCVLSSFLSVFLMLSFAQYVLSALSFSDKTNFSILVGVFVFSAGFSATSLFNFLQKEALFVKELKDEFIGLMRK